MIWRYDPIMFTERYTPEYHLHAFSRLAAGLSGYTKRCVISFVDEYAKNKKALKAISSYLPGQSQLMEFAKKISSAAEKSGITVNSCAEAIDLSSCGIEHGSCIRPPSDGSHHRSSSGFKKRYATESLLRLHGKHRYRYLRHMSLRLRLLLCHPAPPEKSPQSSASTMLLHRCSAVNPGPPKIRSVTGGNKAAATPAVNNILSAWHYRCQLLPYDPLCRHYLSFSAQ